MSQFGLEMRDDQAHEEPEHRQARNRRKGAGLVKSLIAFVLAIGLIGGLLFAGWQGVNWAIDRIPSGAPDYPGPGSGEVTVKINPGDSVTSIGSTLVAADVIKSVKAFVQAADDNSASTSLQPGTYLLLEQMTASDALLALLDPASRQVQKVTVIEGLRESEIVEVLAKGTDLPKKDFQVVLEDPKDLGLPKYADNNAEGFLFPATYEIEPDTSATGLLAQMVSAYNSTATNLDLEARAAKIGRTPMEIVTVASIIQAEASQPDDFAKISRAIYNRLEIGQKLELDSTVNFANGNRDIFTTDEERAIDSPYNTYRYAGLPPGPINSPGEAAIEAALAPAEGNWLYWVPINLDTGETRFTDSYAEHLRNVEVLRKWYAENR